MGDEGAEEEGDEEAFAESEVALVLRRLRKGSAVIFNSLDRARKSESVRGIHFFIY